MPIASWTEQLLTGLAVMLDDAGVGTWREGTAYQANEIAITLVEIPPDPERVICLTDYPLEDDPSLSEGLVGVQVRTRGGRSPMVARALSDGVFDVLHGRRSIVFGEGTAFEVRVAHIYRNSATPIGPDSQGRHERSESYYVHVNRARQGADID